MASINDLQRLYNIHNDNREAFIRAVKSPPISDTSSNNVIGKYWDAQKALEGGGGTGGGTGGSTGGGTGSPSSGLSFFGMLGQTIKTQENTKILSTTDQQTLDIDKLSSVLTKSMGADGLDLDKLIQNIIVDIGIGQIEQYLQNQTALLQTINEEMGMTGDLSKIFRENITNATPELEKMGISFQDVGDAVQTLYNTTGKFSVLSQDTLEQTGKIGKAYLGSIGELMRMYPAFEKIGFGAANAQKEIAEAGKKALNVGLQAKKTLNDLNANLSKINEYGFAKGVQGLADMTRKATEFRMSMDGAFQIADKVMNPEGALEMAANLQVLGGAIGDFNDPLKLMYMSTNNVEGLQDALIGAASSLASYNEEQGRFEIKGANLRRAREMAAQMGVSIQDLTNGAIAFAERTEAANELLAKGFTLDKETEEFITNISQMRGGKMVVELNSKELKAALNTDEQFVALDQLTEAQIMELKEVKKSLEKPPDEIIRDQATNIENIERYVSAILMKFGIEAGKPVKETIDKTTAPVLKFVKEVDTNAKKYEEAVNKAKREAGEKYNVSELKTSKPKVEEPKSEDIKISKNLTPNVFTTFGGAVTGMNVPPAVSSASTQQNTPENTNAAISNLSNITKASAGTSTKDSSVIGASVASAANQTNQKTNIKITTENQEAKGVIEGNNKTLTDKSKENIDSKLEPNQPENIIKTMEVNESPMYKSLQSIEAQLLAGLDKIKSDTQTNKEKTYFTSLGATAIPSSLSNINTETVQKTDIYDTKNFENRISNYLEKEKVKESEKKFEGLKEIFKDQTTTNLLNQNQTDLTTIKDKETQKQQLFNTTTKETFKEYLAKNFPDLDQSQREPNIGSVQNITQTLNRQTLGGDISANTNEYSDVINNMVSQSVPPILKSGVNIYENIIGKSAFQIPEDKTSNIVYSPPTSEQIPSQIQNATTQNEQFSFEKFKIPQITKKEENKFNIENIKRITEMVQIEEYKTMLDEINSKIKEFESVNESFKTYNEVSSTLLPTTNVITNEEIAQPLENRTTTNISNVLGNINQTNTPANQSSYNFNETKTNLLSKNKLASSVNNYISLQENFDESMSEISNNFNDLNNSPNTTTYNFNETKTNLLSRNKLASSVNNYNSLQQQFDDTFSQISSTIGGINNNADISNYDLSSITNNLENYKLGINNIFNNVSTKIGDGINNFLNNQIETPTILNYAKEKASTFGNVLNTYTNNNESDYSILNNSQRYNQIFNPQTPILSNQEQQTFNSFDLNKIKLGFSNPENTTSITPESISSTISEKTNEKTSVYEKLISDQKEYMRETARTEKEAQPKKIVHEVQMINPSPFMDNLAQDMMRRLGQYGIGVNHREYIG